MCRRIWLHNPPVDPVEILGAVPFGKQHQPEDNLDIHIPTWKADFN